MGSRSSSSFAYPQDAGGLGANEAADGNAASLQKRSQKVRLTPGFVTERVELESHHGFVHRAAVLRFLDVTASKQRSLLSHLCSNADLFDAVLSFLDPLHCSVCDRNTLLECWRKMGGDESALRCEAADDVSSWWGVKVKGGRVTWVVWGGLNLSGPIPDEFKRLSGLTRLILYNNKLTGRIPQWIGGDLPSLVQLDLAVNDLEGPIPDGRASSSLSS